MADGGTLRAAWKASAFDQLAHASLDGIWACDADLRCLYWNAAMERLSSLPAARVVGCEIVEVLSRIGEGDVRTAVRQVLEGAPAASTEQRSTGTGQSFVVLRTQLTPIRGQVGEIVGVVAIVRDATAEDRMRQELRETDARFRNMADASPVLLWMSRTDGLCTFFNQTWLEFTGRTLEEEWGVGWAENVHFEDFAECMDTYVDAFNERRPFEIEYRLRRKDGEYRWLLDRGTPRYTPDGRFAGYIGSCVDITERRILEAELRAAIEARDDFLSVASHELGTPLTALKLEIEQLTRLVNGKARDQRLQSRVGSIDAEIQRLGVLVETLLDTTRLRAGAWKLSPEGIDLRQLLEQLLRDLSPVAEAAGCPLTLRTVPSVVGIWDRSRLEQALVNVLSNAFKFGAGEPVEVTLDSDGVSATIRVRDRGVGLPPEQQNVIFSRFGRAPHTRGYGGLGLGLWIARHSIEAMGGTIRVESAVGEGATFELLLNCHSLQTPDLTREGAEVGAAG
jgi:PAS domain S-box-containing protein